MKRNNAIMVRLSDRELELLKKLSASYQLSLSETVRKLIENTVRV
jgi:predicted transcriptional regulator